MPTWDASLYLQFANERTQPAIDLIARIDAAEPGRIVDLGCGPGNSTAILRHRWPGAEIIGLDGSPAMIEAAAQTYPDDEWILADIATWQGDKLFDLVFSNATLHWLPDHTALFPRLLGQVAPGGALAVQMPAHYRSPVHEAILEVANDSRWSHLMDAARRSMTKETPSFYYNLLQPLAARLELWETEYYHVMDGPHSLVDWFRGTGLRPYLEALADDAQRLAFEEGLRSEFGKRYPAEPDGRILFPFRRLFMIAYTSS